MKIAVIGAGGVGSAAARFLARDGHDVTLLEQFAVDHDRGSSYGESRVTRKTYPDGLLTQMMTAAYPLTAELQDEAGEELYARTGGLYFGPDGHPDLEMMEDALKQFGVDYERLSAAEANARYPGFRLLEGETAICQAETGFLRASKCVRANVRLARKHGAELRENTKVERIAQDGSGWRLVTDRGELVVERVIVTAGPWVERLIAGLPVWVSRQQYVHLKIARNEAHFKPGTFPVWIEAKVAARGSEMYGFPYDVINPGVKLAEHKRNRPGVNPDAVDRTLDRAYAKQLIDFAAVRMPDLAGEVVLEKTCLYTNTPDEQFILGLAPGQSGVVVVGGLCGEGFKFTTLFGRIAADLATDRKVAFDLSRFDPARFSK